MLRVLLYLGALVGWTVLALEDNAGQMTSLEETIYTKVLTRLHKEMAADKREIELLKLETLSQRVALENNKHENDLLKAEVLRQKNALKSVHQSVLDLAPRRDTVTSEETQIAFSVARISDFGPVSVDTNIPYDVVYVNVGDGWHGPINAFLAPTSGVYFFSATMFASSGDRGVCTIVHTDSMSGEQKAHMYATSSSSVGHSNQVVLELSQGDYVSVQLLGGSYKIHSTPTSVYNTFSGFLLYTT